MSECDFFHKGLCGKYDCDFDCMYDVVYNGGIENCQIGTGEIEEFFNRKRENIAAAKTRSVQCQTEMIINNDYRSCSSCHLGVSGKCEGNNFTQWSIEMLLKANLDFLINILGFYGLRAKSKEAEHARWLNKKLLEIIKRGEQK